MRITTDKPHLKVIRCTKCKWTKTTKIIKGILSAINFFFDMMFPWKSCEKTSLQCENNFSIKVISLWISLFAYPRLLRSVFAYAFFVPHNHIWTQTINQSYSCCRQRWAKQNHHITMERKKKDLLEAWV